MTTPVAQKGDVVLQRIGGVSLILGAVLTIIGTMCRSRCPGVITMVMMASLIHPRLPPRNQVKLPCASAPGRGRVG